MSLIIVVQFFIKLDYMSYVNIATNRCKERIVRPGSWWPPDLMWHSGLFLNGPGHYFVSW